MPKSTLWFKEFKSYIVEEFIAHLPYTIVGVIAGLILIIVVRLLNVITVTEREFHFAHYIHLFFSGAASAAIFRSYRNSIWKAIPIAFISSVLLCALSDIFIPYLGLVVTGYYDTPLHICTIEHPLTVGLSALGGIVVGLLGIKFFAHCNRSFHLLHMLISTTASTLYMLTYIPILDLQAIVSMGATLFVALVIPCIAGDVIVPLCFITIRDEFTHHKVHHH